MTELLPSGGSRGVYESSFISQFFEPLLGVVVNPIPCVGLLRENIHVHFRPVGKCDNDHPVMPRLHGPGLKPDLGARFGHGSQYAPKALKSRTPSLEAASARRLCVLPVGGALAARRAPISLRRELRQPRTSAPLWGAPQRDRY